MSKATKKLAKRKTATQKTRKEIQKAPRKKAA